VEPYPLALQQWQSEAGCAELLRLWNMRQRDTIVHDLVEGFPLHRTIIDLGCGSGYVVRQLPKFDRYVGIDLSPYLLAVARAEHAADSRVRFAERDFLGGATYRRALDVLLLIDVNRHYPDPLAMTTLVLETWPARGAVISTLHGPQEQELINGKIVATQALDQAQLEWGEVLRAVELELGGGLSVRYTAIALGRSEK